MSEKTFEVNIITPERNFFKDQVDMITVETIDGSLGLLKNASNQVIALVPGEIKITKDGSGLTASYGNGYIKVKNGIVVMLVETAEWPSEIDPSRVKDTIAENEDIIRFKKAHYEHTWGKSNIARALARLKVKNKDE